MKFKADQQNRKPDGDAAVSDRDQVRRAFAVAHLERCQRLDRRRRQSSMPFASGPKSVARFARTITMRHANPPGANPRGLLSAYFGARFKWMTGTGFSRARVYRQLGRFSRQTLHKSITELFMSVNFSRFMNCAPFLFEQLRGSKMAAERWQLKAGIQSRGESKSATLTTRTPMTHSLIPLWVIKEAL